MKPALVVTVAIGLFETANIDGSISAQSIQLNPQFRVGAVK